MTTKEARKLIPDKSYVRYAGSKYKVADIRIMLGNIFVGIYDEPPSKHVDYINAASLEVYK